MKKHICIISFSPIHQDGRVLRQIHYLAPHYKLTVIGYGEAHPDWRDVTWIPITRGASRLDKIGTLILLILGKVWPPLYELAFWRRPYYRQAREQAAGSAPDAFYANEWSAVPVAVAASKRNKVPIVYDAHDYSPLQHEDSRLWLTFYAPLINHMLRRYTPRIDAAITVAAPIARRWRDEFGFEPMVVLNAPAAIDIPARSVDPARIRLIHHGAAQRNRRLEVMIEALRLADQRFELHLMLMDLEAGYIQDLKRLADQLAPGRVFFHDPVLPGQIVATIAQYDIGIFVIEPILYNYLMAMPNKFFEFMAAGLAVCIGPSPAMAEMVREHGFGVVAASFEARGVAAALNGLTTENIKAMRAAARRAAQVFNADAEMAKVIALFGRLFSTQAQ